MGLEYRRKRKLCEAQISLSVTFLPPLHQEKVRKERRDGHSANFGEGDMDVFLWVRMIKGNLFVFSLIRKNEVWKWSRSGKEGSKQEHVFIFLEEEVGEDKQGYQNIMVSSPLASLLLLNKQTSGWFLILVKPQVTQEHKVLQNVIDNTSSTWDYTRCFSEEIWSMCGHRMHVYACTSKA